MAGEQPADHVRARWQRAVERRQVPVQAEGDVAAGLRLWVLAVTWGEDWSLRDAHEVMQNLHVAWRARRLRRHQ